jgi:hypothetical protein
MTQWGLDGLFNPGRRHTEEERRRLESTREEVGDASGGRRVDLDAGTVVIRVNRGGGADAADVTSEDGPPPADEQAEPTP